MADEAFALSPISARAELPSQADYEAIREAFMETARGRWFLGEYGKRNRNADTTMVLDAVARIEATIAAHKQPPPDLLPDALVVIRGLLSDARASAAKTMSGPDAAAALAAVNKGTRIIREIAWTLREYGTDARICDMLDSQVGAIESSHQHTVAAEKREAVLAMFDLLIRKIGELGGSGAMPPWADSETASVSSTAAAPDATGETAEVTRFADIPASTASDHAPPDETSMQGPEVSAAAEPVTARVRESVLADEAATLTGDASVETAQACEASTAAAPAALHPQQTVAGTEAAPPFNPHGGAAPTYQSLPGPQPTPETSAALATPSIAEGAPDELTEEEIIATVDAQAEALDLESVQDLVAQDLVVQDLDAQDVDARDFPTENLTPQNLTAEELTAEELVAQDLAVLDAIAQEMAEPAFAPAAPAGPIVAPDAAECETISFDDIAADLAESGRAKPVVDEAATSQPAVVEPARAEPVKAEPVKAEPVKAEPVASAIVAERGSEIALLQDQKPATVPQTSLGATLIASGIVQRSSAANDALAPIRRMSQAERVAFFS